MGAGAEVGTGNIDTCKPLSLDACPQVVSTFTLFVLQVDAVKGVFTTTAESLTLEFKAHFR